MAANFRLDLVGQKVLRIERDPEGVGVQFSNGWKLAILAHAELRSQCKANGVDALVGGELTHFSGNDESETLTFNNGCELVISLGTAPSPAEAMVLYGPNGMTVVWD